MFDQLVPQFNSSWKPTSGLEYVNGIDQPSHDGTDGIEYLSAFSGVPGLSAARRNTGDGSFTLYRTINPEEQWKANATIGPDGKVNIGEWAHDRVTPLKQQLAEFAALAAAAYGGLNAAGFLGGGGATAGAGAGAASGAGATGSTGAVDALSSYFGGLGGAEGSLAATGLPAAGGEWAALASSAGAPAWEAAAGAIPEIGMGGMSSGLPASFAADFGLSGGIGNALTSMLPSSAGGWLNLGGNLLSGAMGSRAAGKAADAQLQAGRESNALIKSMYDQTRSDNMPALDARNYALGGYRNLLANPSGVTADPGYQFTLNEGTKALERSAAARGGLYSGRAMKESQRFGQDLATSKLDNALNRFGNLAGLGQVGAGTVANAGQNYGNQVGNNMLSMGNAAASGYVGSNNAWSNAISGALKGWQEEDLLKRLFPGQGG